ncbi:hypothetical protein BDY17DRAFT_324275 [Neohortaea acidophila]|uniref:Uncharacterized protein n=1 Tax=Neohortaea acidophila TaxID=245834 RepID=A0A6A6PVP7_9PEZI|nr:uncharacterized protein BDY17DRAFT_324275 [Neohortaea acidophila]KAF2483553.1 hypothetical protein BDY17DRAFT_324275 [Neohortaea acidophila]
MPPKKEQIGTYYPESGPQAAVPSATRSRLAYRLLSHRRRSGKGPALTVPLCAPQSVTTGSDADSSSLQSPTRRFRRRPSSEDVVVPRQHPTTGFGDEKYDYAGLRQLVLDHIILAEDERRRENLQSARVEAANVTIIFSPHCIEEGNSWAKTYTGYVIKRKDGDAVEPFAVLLIGEARETFGRAMENLLTLAAARLEAYSSDIKEAIWRATR